MFLTLSSLSVIQNQVTDGCFRAFYWSLICLITSFHAAVSLLCEKFPSFSSSYSSSSSSAFLALRSALTSAAVHLC